MACDDGGLCFWFVDWILSDNKDPDQASLLSNLEAAVLCMSVDGVLGTIPCSAATTRSAQQEAAPPQTTTGDNTPPRAPSTQPADSKLVPVPLLSSSLAPVPSHEEKTSTDNTAAAAISGTQSTVKSKADSSTNGAATPDQKSNNGSSTAEAPTDQLPTPDTSEGSIALSQVQALLEVLTFV